MSRERDDEWQRDLEPHGAVPEPEQAELGFWQGDPRMVEVCCRDCGASLGYQPAEVELTEEQRAELWHHNRCPAATAAMLDITREDLAGLITIAAAAINAAYPDFPHNVLDDEQENRVRDYRARIAAELVAERLGQAGFTMRNRYRLAGHWSTWAGDGVGP